MKVQEFIKTLGYGVLSNLGSVADEDTLEIKASAVPRIVHFINEGLLRLYNRFPLKVSTVFIELTENKTVYTITKEHFLTVEEYGEERHDYDKYLWGGYDTPEFKDDLLRIDEVFTHEGVRLPINDYADMYSILTPKYNEIEVPTTFYGGILSVVYRARHPVVTYEDNDVIDLPEPLFDALANYIAYKLYSNINTETAVGNANKYFTEYSNIIDELIQSGVLNTDCTEAYAKFYQRGWC